MRLKITITGLIFFSNICLADTSTDSIGIDNTHKYSYIIKLLDKDDDRRLSFIEAMEDLDFAEKFLEYDVNKDGYINLQELNKTSPIDSGQINFLTNSTALIQL